MSKKPPLTASDVADWFINRVDRGAGETITPLAVQKLVFFAQAWYMANRGTPLFDDDFQAWAHGPVVRSLFDRFKHLSWESIPVVETVKKITGEPLKLLEAVFAEYGGYGAKKLEEMTHIRGGPWAKARGDAAPEARCENIIPKQAIMKFYGKKIGKVWA